MEIATSFADRIIVIQLARSEKMEKNERENDRFYSGKRRTIIITYYYKKSFCTRKNENRSSGGRLIRTDFSTRELDRIRE